MRRERVREEYVSEEFLRRHEPSHPGNRWLLQARHDALGEAIARLAPDHRGRCLEVGCGNGQNLPLLAARGAGHELSVGVDFRHDVLQAMRRDLGEVPRPVCADARALPFNRGSFDLVCQIMLLSSLVDPRDRTEAAAEMRRVLRTGGAIVSLDLRWPRPGDRGRIALRRRDLADLFPGFSMLSTTHGILPPLARVLAARFPWVCGLLQRWPPLRIYRLDILWRDRPLHFATLQRSGGRS